MSPACRCGHPAHVDVVLHRDDRAAAERLRIDEYERAKVRTRVDATHCTRGPRSHRQAGARAAAAGADVSARILAAILSATIILVPLMFTRRQSGMIDAST